MVAMASNNIQYKYLLKYNLEHFYLFVKEIKLDAKSYFNIVVMVQLILARIKTVKHSNNYQLY